ITLATTLPSTPPAAATETPTLIGTAPCGSPVDTARTTISPAFSSCAVSPASPATACRGGAGGGAETRQIFGTPAGVSPTSAHIPISTAARHLIRSNLSNKPVDTLISAGEISPGTPILAASMKTHGFDASIHVTSTPSKTSTARPVGSSFPVFDPEGERKASLMQDPVPGTPEMEKSPTAAASPSTTGTVASISLLVFVLWILTTASSSPTFPAEAEGTCTNPSSTANAATPAVIFPQLPA
ncbi:hypothetical protein V493_07698, partial [Pseudogymnoascus sp. VKM F-4281 (FW-2241)]